MTGEDYIQGHVEVEYDGMWGSICDDFFENDDNGAQVLCRMMGFVGGQYSEDYRSGSWTNTSKVWLDDVVCQGDETDIQNCKHRPWGQENCDSSEAAAIRCTYPSKWH